ncbi:hypothetical protein ACX281_12545 (plasmid) [Cetobacterium somerae]
MIKIFIVDFNFLIYYYTYETLPVSLEFPNILGLGSSNIKLRCFLSYSFFVPRKLYTIKK